MSKKYALKRIALVAISAMGFGLLSMVPANAAAAAVTALTASIKSGASDNTLTIGSAQGSALGLTYNVYTRHSTVALADIQMTITSEGDTTAGFRQLVVAAGTTTSVGSTAPTVYIKTAALTSGTATSLANSASDADAPGQASGVASSTALTAFTASASGTSYVVWNDGIIASSGLGSTGAENELYTSTEAYVVLNVIQTSAEAVTVSLVNASTTIAARVNQQVSITPTGDYTSLTTGSASHPTMRIAASITSQPSGSLIYPTLTAVSLAETDFVFATTGTSVGSTAISTSTTVDGSASGVASINYSGYADKTISGSNASLATLTFTPSKVGTYSVTIWNESSTSGEASLSGSESYKVFTINVSSGVSAVALSVRGSTAPTTSGAYGAYGALVRVALTDASGNAAILAPGETVTLTPSGSGDIARVNNNTVTSAAGAAYNLASTAFNSSGVAFVNVVDATEEAINLTASINGGATVSTAITYKAITAIAVAAAPYQATRTAYLASGSATSVQLASQATTFRAAATSANYTNFTITEQLCDSGVGSITGYTTALTYEVAALAASSISSTSVTGGCSTAEVFYTVDTIAGGTATNTVSGVARTTGVVTINAANINAVVGSSNTVTVTLKDQFGAAYPYQTVQATVAGKNPVTTARTAVTDTAGQVTFTFTDANTNTAVNDVVTFTAGSTATTTISYGTNAVGTITMEYPNEDDVVAGTTFTEISAAGAGATGTSATVSAIITGSTGAVLAGVPVTFAVSGLTGAEVHTTKVTVYTDTTGYATTSISSYAAGKATVTATAGGKSSTADIYFKQTGASEARTIAATVSGSVVTATVKDRYGNTIEGVAVNATRTGSGYFGSGASTASGNTDKNGQIEFIFTGTGTVTVAFSAADYGQSADAAGKVGITAVTASAAGTTTTAQTGLGAALAPAGVNSASVAVASVDAAAAAAEAASDAAAEAIDAANAATDAANLAAEAADAATVAAEEARDAADAATAAVEELATQVATLMAALKAQITTLANTVAKIAKKVKA